MWVIHCHPSFCQCFHDLRRKHYPLIRLSLSFLLLTPTVSYFRRCRLPVESFSTKGHRRHGAEFLVGGVEDCRLSFLSPPLPRIVLDLGTRSLVGGVACNSPVFAKIKNFIFGVNCLIV